jgi:hypothetical protein
VCVLYNKMVTSLSKIYTLNFPNHLPFFGDLLIPNSHRGMDSIFVSTNIWLISPVEFSKDSAYFVIQCSGDIQLINVESNDVLFTIPHENLSGLYNQEYLYFFRNTEEIIILFPSPVDDFSAYSIFTKPPIPLFFPYFFHQRFSCFSTFKTFLMVSQQNILISSLNVFNMPSKNQIWNFFFMFFLFQCLDRS